MKITPPTEKRAQDSIDFAIVTAIDVERRAVCRAFKLKDSDRVRKDSRVYWRGRLALSDGEFYEIVVAQLSDMANVDAALLTADLIHHWGPGALLLVGVAGAASDGSKADDEALGDLIIGSDVYYYERGKVATGGKKPEPYMYKADATLWNNVTAVPEWKGRIGVARPDGKTARPSILRGVIASGEKVIAEAAARDELAGGHRKIRAIEMEGYGFSAAVWQSFDRRRHLVLKAICDRADRDKSEDWQPYAAAVAANFAKYFLEDRPLEPRNQPQNNNETDSAVDAPDTSQQTPDQADASPASSQAGTATVHPNQPISSKAVTDVKSILGKLDLAEAVIRRSYYASSPAASPPLEEFRGEPLGLLFFCVERLAKMACRVPDVAPLLGFLERLSAHIADETERTRLRDLSAGIARELGVDISLIRRRVKEQDKASKAGSLGEPYLLVKVERSLWNSEEFEIKGWLLYADAYYGLTLEEGPHNFKEFPDLLKDLIEESQERLLSLDGEAHDLLAKLVIEVFLPTDLLACDIDRWSMPAGRTMRPVGTLYRVVVRSYDRTYHKAYRLLPRAYWLEKWQTRPRSLGELTDTHMCWACCANDLRANLFDKLRDSGVLFLALLPLLPSQTPDVSEVLGTVLDAGTPIALWPRRHLGDTTVAQKKVRDLVYERELDKLPDAVYAKRKGAILNTREDTIWNHLTLLWDDPDRTPPDVRNKLRAPR